MAQSADELRLKTLQEAISNCVAATKEIIRTMYAPSTKLIASDQHIHKEFIDFVLPHLKNAIKLIIIYSPDSKELIEKENELINITAALFLTGLSEIKRKCYQAQNSIITMAQFHSSSALDKQEQVLPAQAFDLFKVLFDIKFKNFIASSNHEDLRKNVVEIRQTFQAALKLAESMHKFYADKKDGWGHTMIGRQYHIFDEKQPADRPEQKSDQSSMHKTST